MLLVNFHIILYCPDHLTIDASCKLEDVIIIDEQIRNKLAFSEGVVKQSRVRSTMRWWTKCISMVIAKTASRNVAFKANVMSQAVLEAQSTFAMSEATDQDAASLRRSLNDRDVVCNADLYVFNHEVDNG